MTSSESEEEAPSLIVHTDADDSEEQRSVALTIITGFLGAGKSTLLRHILTGQHGYRIAVVMNEFGDTADIEAKAISISTGDDPATQAAIDILEFSNGCLCCSIKNSGVAAIERLLQLKGAYDYILLETTGLADPAPIASMFWQNEEFSSMSKYEIVLDGVVCVVDAVFGGKQMAEDHSSEGIGESLRQIGCADVILLNKSDLTSEQEMLSLENRIRTVNPVAPLYRTVRGLIDLKLILGIDAYRTTSHHSDAPLHSSLSHTHEPERFPLHAVSALCLTCPTLNPSTLTKLDIWIRTVLWDNHLPSDKGDHPLTVLRCKGYFQSESGAEYMLQGVRDIYELIEVGRSPSVARDSGKLVLIGKGLDDNDAVRESFETIFSDRVLTVVDPSD